MANKTFNTRVKNKRDTAANWEAVATTFQPLDGELIIVDTAAGKTRFKVGRYDTAKGRLLYYNEIPFTDEYLYNDLNESQGKIYDKLKGIDDKSIIEMTLEPSNGNGEVCVYHIGLWQFPKTGLYKIHLTQHGTISDLFKVFARKTKDDGTLPEDFNQDNLVIQQLAMGDTQVNDLYIQVDYTDNDKLTVYNVRFLTLLQPYNAQVNVYDKTTQKWQFVSATYVQSAKSADRLAHQLTLTKGDTTTKFDGSTAQAVSIPTKTSELTNDSNFTTQTDLDNLTNTVVSYSAQENITSEQKAQARTNIGAISSSELVQSDWNQNDTTAKDYVKNRICYEEETVTELGNTYAVWNELTTADRYTPISYKMNGTIYKDVVPTYRPTTGVYMYNGVAPYDHSIVVSTQNGSIHSGGVNFQFVKVENTVKQIDPKFIPTVSPDWNQNDENAKDYIKNRICYAEDGTIDVYYDSANNKLSVRSIDLQLGATYNVKTSTNVSVIPSGNGTDYVCKKITDVISELSSVPEYENVLCIGGWNSETHRPDPFLVTDEPQLMSITVQRYLITGSNLKINALSMKYLPTDLSLFKVVTYDSENNKYAYVNTDIEFLQPTTTTSFIRGNKPVGNNNVIYIGMPAYNNYGQSPFRVESDIIPYIDTYYNFNLAGNNLPDIALGKSVSYNDSGVNGISNAKDLKIFQQKYAKTNQNSVIIRGVMIFKDVTLTGYCTLDNDSTDDKPKISFFDSYKGKIYKCSFTANGDTQILVEIQNIWDNTIVSSSDVLTKTNTTAFTPTADYQPATKKYVDDNKTTMLQSLLPKVTTITLTSNWVGDASPYYQDIALSCVTETSIVDLQPTPEQLNSWQDDGVAFTTLSGNGTVRVYVAGGKPSSAISVQVRVQEVTVI